MSVFKAKLICPHCNTENRVWATICKNKDCGKLLPIANGTNTK